GSGGAGESGGADGSDSSGSSGSGGSGSSSSGGSGGSGSSDGSDGAGGSGSGSSGSGGFGDSGTGGAGGPISGGSSDSGGAGSIGGSDSGGSGRSGSGGSGGSGSDGSGSGSSGGSSSGGSGGSGGSGSGGAGGNGSGGSGSAGSGDSGSGGAGGAGSGSSGSGGVSGTSSGTIPEGVPGAVIPGSPYPNPDASSQVMVGANQTATITPGAAVTPSTVPAGLPDGGSKTSDDGAHSNLAKILGGLFGGIALIALVGLLFVLAKRRRERHDDAEADAGGSGAAGPGDNTLGGGGSMGPDGAFYSPGIIPPKQHTPGAPGGGTGGIPPLAPVGGASGSDAPSGPGAAVGGAVLVAGAIANKHKRKESLNLKDQRQEQTFEAGHSTTEDSPTDNINNSVLSAKRSSKAKFFMGGGDYKPPLRRPSPVLPEPTTPMLPITTVGSKTEVDDTLESVEVKPREEHMVPGSGNSKTNSSTTVTRTNSGTSSSNNNGAIIAGTATGIALAAGGIANAHHSNKETRVDGSSSKTATKTTTTNGGKSTTTTTTVTGSGSGPYETEEVLHGTDGTLEGEIPGHGRFESTASTGMNISSSSSVMYQSGSTSTTSVASMHVGGNQIVTSNGKSTVASSSSAERLVGEMVVAGTATGVLTQQQKEQQQHILLQRQQGPPTIHKTQITLKLSIIRYERSDASQATPNAKPGTLMFSQVEMLDGAPDVRIPGSAFSHVRDSSKVTGQEEGLPSPVVPGPSGAARSTESEVRERSLRWMTNEFKWKREAGMLQHLRSDVHIAELFTLYSLPSFAEYRYVSVMGPFTRTLDTYIKERRGIRTTPPSQPLTPEQVSLQAKGPLTVVEIKNLTDSIASALKWCHDHHVVHLSLSPASIFLQEYYSEPDGQGGYRASVYSNYSSRNSSITDGEAPTIVQQWKLWDFSNARFVGEAVDLTMDTTGYTSPEILIASRRHSQKTTIVKTTSEAENPNQDTTVTTTVSPDGVVTKTTTIKSSSAEGSATVVRSQDQEKLMANQTMDMWSLGQIVYEMHTTQPMFTSAEDALEKLTSALEKQEESEGDDDDGDDLDKAKAHDKIRQQLQDQIQKIQNIPDMGAREVITGLLEMRQERRLDHEEIRNLYLDLQD
ncbi:hypothetical protein BG015_011394, partial [Linnemannia schmuckeri]